MFEKELLSIKNAKIKNIAEQAIAKVPDFFMTLPASSSGKYHPNYAIGEGGLYRHVKAALLIAEELFRLEQFPFTEDEKDIIRVSIMLHDCWKQGVLRNGHTIFDHPIVASKEIESAVIVESEEEKYFVKEVCKNIESHMGQWNVDVYPKGMPKPNLPKPETDMQKFVHLCDYIASRKILEVNFSAV